MIKELIISILIIVLIFVGDAVTQNYTKQSIEEVSVDLKELREELIEDDINFERVKNSIDKIHDNWDDKYEKLAYYIEHDELEKVKTELTSLRGYIEKEEYSEAFADVDRSIYILEHIKDKNSFNLKNIF